MDTNGKVSNMVIAAAIAGFVSGIPSAIVSSYVAIQLLENNMASLKTEVNEIKTDQRETQKSIAAINIKLERISAIQDYQGGGRSSDTPQRMPKQ